MKCKTFRRTCNRIKVHTVGTGTHNPAKPCRSELKILVKSIFNFNRIVRNRNELSQCRRIESGVFQPTLVNSLCT
jgi:hypothetical protein